MSHTSLHSSHWDFHSPSKRFRLLISWIIITTTFGLFGNIVSYGQQRSVTRSRIVRRKPATERSVPASPEDESPQDPAIVAESRRLAARRLEEQQNLERDLLAKNSSAQTPAANYLEGFRQTFPFLSQVIALSDATRDGSRTLIISEPPPHATLGNILTTVGGNLLLNHYVKKHDIGYDGWVKDVVIAIKGNDDEIQAMLSRLNQLLFFTSYKSYTLPLPVKIVAKRVDLNLKVTPEETRRWVVEGNEQFFPVEGGKAQTLADLAAEFSSGVYVSRTRGLVGWWIPKARNIYECRIPARQFSLDSDLIVGAIANRYGVFVLGRERIVPVEVLPPLRFETLALLADDQKGQDGELKQSYERTHAFAGRIDDENDWAPILLSPQLRDTEYGSLLNVTDQLLKSWSNKGETKYRKFSYPQPREYPFSKPLFDELGVSATGGSLTYNWNTKGAGYTINSGATTILALNRTGSLPVSYIPEGMERSNPVVVSAEDKGYDVFSRLSDPNLVRVVQYAGIYQIFSAFNMTRSPKPIASDEYPDQLLESMTRELYADLRGSSDQDLNNLTDRLSPAITKSLSAMVTSFMTEGADELRNEIDSGLRKKGFVPGSSAYNQKYQEVFEDIKRDLTQRLKGAIVEDIRKQLEMLRLNRPAKDETDRAMREVILSQFAGYKEVPRRYAEAIDARAKGWIHTPVVVLSWNTNEELVGGHNLDARVSKIVADEKVPPGQVSIDAKGDLLVNPIDLPRARGLAREVERNQLIGQLALAARNHDTARFEATVTRLQSALSRAESAPIEARETALHLGQPPPNKPPINKPIMSTGEPGPSGSAGWGGDGRSSQLVSVARERGEPDTSVLISQRTDGRFDLSIIADGRKSTLLALTNEDALDAAVIQLGRRSKPGEPALVEFEGMPEHKVQAALDTMKIRMSDQGENIELVARPRSPWGSSVLTKEYDFGRSTVKVSEINTLPTGELSENVSLEVPSAGGDGETLSFTSEMTFDKETPRGVISAVKDRVSNSFTRLATRWRSLTKSVRYEADVRTYNVELARALKRVKAKTNLNFGLKTRLKFSVGRHQGLSDIYISEREPIDGFASGAAASKSE